MKTYQQQIIETTEARRHNGQNPYGPWMDLADEDIPDHVREAIADEIAEATHRDMRREKSANTDESGSIEIGGQTWMYRR